MLDPPRTHIAAVILATLMCSLTLVGMPASATEEPALRVDTSSVVPSFSVYFDGKHQGSIIRIPFHISQNSYVATRGLTFEAWIKPMRNDTGGSILNKAVGMCKDDWILNQTPSLGIEFKLANSCTGNNRFLEASNILDLGEWQHIAGVWDGDSLRLFINGRQILRSRCDGVPSANAIDMSIGANNHWNGDRVSFMGYIDEVRFSNTPRYQSDFTPALRLRSDDRTVLLFHFDEGSGEVLHDSSLVGLLAYGESIAWAQDVAPAFVSGSVPPEAGMPPTDGIDGVRSSSLAWILPIVLGGMAVGGYLWFVRRSRSATGMIMAPSPSPGAVRGVMIELFGGFHIRGSDGSDMSEWITGRNRELFLIILLHTVRGMGNGTGIGTAKMTSALWPDLDPQTAKNARGVAIKRLREALAEVGDVQVTQSDSVWRIVLGADIHCDLFDLAEEFGSSMRVRRPEAAPEIERFLELVGKGRFLADVDHPWLDPIRTDVENRIVGDIERALGPDVKGLPQPLIIALADAGLALEPVNERFLSAKLKALAAMGRLTAARAAYTRFAEDYRGIAGASYPRSFQDCIGPDAGITGH